MNNEKGFYPMKAFIILFIECVENYIYFCVVCWLKLNEAKSKQ